MYFINAFDLLNDFNSVLFYFITIATAIAIILFIVGMIRKKTGNKTDAVIKQQSDFKYDAFLRYLGDRDNVVSVVAHGSRLVVIPKKFEIVRVDKIKELGVTGIVKTDKSFTFVIGSRAKSVAAYIQK